MATAADLTKQGIAAIQAGDRARGAALLLRATEADPRYEMAWLWRSSVAASDDEKRHCLEQALKANPNSAPARKGLALLGPAIDAPPELAAPVEVAAPAVTVASTGDRALVQQELFKRTSQGWQIVAQTETTVQLKKSKQWSAAGLALFVIAPAALGCLWTPAFGIALIGLVLVLAAYLSAKDELVFLDAATIRTAQITGIVNTVTLGGRPTKRQDAIIAGGVVLVVLVALGGAWAYSALLKVPISSPSRGAAPAGASVYGTVAGYTDSTGRRVIDINLFDKPASAAPPFQTVGHARAGQLVAVLEQRADGAIKVRTPQGVVGWTQIDFVKDIK